MRSDETAHTAKITCGFRNLQYSKSDFQFAIFILTLAVIISLSFACHGLVEVELPEPNRSDPITISADAANKWQSGSYDVWLLQWQLPHSTRRCRYRDAERPCSGSIGPMAMKSRKAKLSPTWKATWNCAKRLHSGPVRMQDQNWFGRFFTKEDIQVYVASGKLPASRLLCRRSTSAAWNVAIRFRPIR